ncbi:MAG TPA: class I SAM-dependent RNA methyltransferase [Candidatus Nanopelagicaceae bacterium]|nr:class I SAM-dependent RNA methyltransferase [Candidatus Nanopelagicaceae bacterium]
MPGVRIRLDCDSLAHRGLGLGRFQGMVVFLFGALPGEDVTAVVTKVHARHAFADTVEVHRSSPERVDPVCPHFGTCGGCQLQHAAYPLQLRAKAAVLQEALTRRGIDMPGATDAVGSREPWRYRWRGEFHLDPKQARVGFTSRQGHRVVAIDDCPIHHPALTGMLPALGRALGKGAEGVQTVHLTVGSEGHEVLLQTRPYPAAGEALAVALGGETGPAVTIESTELSYRGRRFRVFPDSFIQVNQGSLEDLYETVIDWLRPSLPGVSVVDAYGGSGVLSLRLVDEGAVVTVIESNPISARLCQLHGEMYAPGRLTVQCGPVEELLPTVDGPAVVVLDPPRSGLAPQVTGWLSLAGPPVIAYLSCEVSALARDLEALCRLGPYRLERLRLVDMFPQTYHFEVVALLRRL